MSTKNENTNIDSDQTTSKLEEPKKATENVQLLKKKSRITLSFWYSRSLHPNR